MKRQFFLPILTVAVILTGIAAHTVVSAQFSEEEWIECIDMGRDDQTCSELDEFLDEVEERTSGTPSASRTISNAGFTIRLNFMDEIPLPDGSEEPWTEATQQPYVEVAEQWLEIISGVQGVDRHRLTINFAVMDVGDDALGIAAVDYESLQVYGPHVMPTQGYIVVNDIFYDAAAILEFDGEDAVREELDANIAHEIGHVLGIGSLWNLDALEPGRLDGSETDYTGSYRNWSIESPFDDGVIYQKLNSAAIANYNQMFGTKFDFLPINFGHLYSIQQQEEDFGGNGKRYDSNGRQIPEMGWELMGHGMILSPITIGLLEDLGWAVNYEAVEALARTR